MFNSELVRSLMMELGGMASNDLDEIIYTFQDADTDLMKSISRVATLVADYIGCIEMNRFVVYPSQGDLEVAAAKLSRKNELLAGWLSFDR